MRKPEYISPSSLSIYMKDPALYYERYCADNRPPRIPQTKSMAVGSAFDAYVKSHLAAVLLDDDRYAFETLFTAQVESQNRDFALEAGLVCFRAYEKSGALVDLLTELKSSQVTPRMEFELRAVVDGVPFLGRPDLWFQLNDGHIICDWKVNGYCSKGTTSPAPGYAKLRGGLSKEHKDYVPVRFKGIFINGQAPLNTVNADWAMQQSIYAWCLGEPVGGDFIVYIEQLVCKDNWPHFPIIRVASHRALVSEGFQQGVLESAKRLWESLQIEWMFRDLSHEESKERQKLLDLQGLAVTDKLTEEMTRGGF